MDILTKFMQRASIQQNQQNQQKSYVERKEEEIIRQIMNYSLNEANQFPPNNSQNNSHNNECDPELLEAINNSLNETKGNHSNVSSSEDDQIQRAINESLMETVCDSALDNDQSPEYDPYFDPSFSGLSNPNDNSDMHIVDSGISKKRKMEEADSAASKDTILSSLFKTTQAMLSRLSSSSTPTTPTAPTTSTTSTTPTTSNTQPISNSVQTSSVSTTVTTSTAKHYANNTNNTNNKNNTSSTNNIGTTNEFAIKLLPSFSREFIGQSVNLSPFTEKEKKFYQNSDKIILPQSSITQLAQVDSKLYVLRVVHPKTKKITFVCASDFSAPERTMYVPDWVLASLGGSSGDRLFVDLIKIPVATEVTVKVPLGFQKLSNPMSIIEYCLRNHSIMFKAKKFSINMFEKVYTFEIVNMKPANIGNIANADVKLSIIEEN